MSKSCIFRNQIKGCQETIGNTKLFYRGAASATKKRYYTATQFSLYFTTFSGCSISTPRYHTLRAVEKTPTGFKVLRLPRKNVLHAPGCDKMAILDHGEVLPQTLLHARRCGKTQILQDFDLPHSKNFINV